MEATINCVTETAESGAGLDLSFFEPGVDMAVVKTRFSDCPENDRRLGDVTMKSAQNQTIKAAMKKR